MGVIQKHFLQFVLKEDWNKYVGVPKMQNDFPTFVLRIDKSCLSQKEHKLFEHPCLKRLKEENQQKLQKEEIRHRSNSLLQEGKLHSTVNFSKQHHSF